MPVATVEIIEALDNFLLLQRNLEQDGFFNASQTHAIVGVTSLIASDACYYVSSIQLYFKLCIDITCFATTAG